MPNRLAIAISGAVSLGSYEAGVMFEIIRAIGEHNSNTENEDDKIYIDVLTGASAGGMTAAILAQKLLFDADKLVEPLDNDLHGPWVKDIDISNLLANSPSENSNNSIFSSKAVEDIANRYFLGRYEPGGYKPAKRHMASAKQLKLGLAMSNLNGIKYGIPAFEGSDLLKPDGAFVYRRHQDQKFVSIDATNDNRTFWEPIVDTARSCGAFPFAFPTVKVKRDRHGETYKREDNIIGWDEGDRDFAYSDGGAFNNYPLGMAKRLAKEIDSGSNDYTNRYYIYVSPNSLGKTGTIDFEVSNGDFKKTGLALAGAVLTQAGFQDWIMTAQINESVDRFDKQAENLRTLVSGMGTEERSKLGVASELVLESLYNGDNVARVREFKRLSEQFLDEAGLELKDAHGDEAVSVWISAVQVLEKSANLGNRDIMNIYTITAEEKELAGEDIYAFGGFLMRKFRDFDYAAGRKKALSFLNALKASAGQNNRYEMNHLPLTNFENRSPRDIDQDDTLGTATMKDVDREVRNDLYRRFVQRADLILKQFGLNSLIRKPVVWWWVKPNLKKMLHL